MIKNIGLALLSLLFCAPTSWAQLKESKPLWGVNYYPRNKIWEDFWNQYNESRTVIESDLKLIHTLGFNTVRIFINYGVFSSPAVQKKALANAIHFLDESKKNNLKVIVTLFDWSQVYDRPKEIESSLKFLIPPLKNHPAILAWDLKNEPDLDYRFYPTGNVVDNGLREILKQVNLLAPMAMTTIGWLNPQPALASVGSFLSFHFYGPGGSFLSRFQEVRKYAPKLPIVIEEFGYATPAGDFEVQEKYLRDLLITAMNTGEFSGALMWTLYDHSPTAGRKRPEHENHFGLITLEGKEKPAMTLFTTPLLGRIEESDLLLCGRFEKKGILSFEISNLASPTTRQKLKWSPKLGASCQSFGIKTVLATGKAGNLLSLKVLSGENLLAPGRWNSPLEIRIKPL